MTGANTSSTSHRASASGVEALSSNELIREGDFFFIKPERSKRWLVLFPRFSAGHTKWLVFLLVVPSKKPTGRVPVPGPVGKPQCKMSGQARELLLWKAWLSRKQDRLEREVCLPLSNLSGIWNLASWNRTKSSSFGECLPWQEGTLIKRSFT